VRGLISVKVSHTHDIFAFTASNCDDECIMFSGLGAIVDLFLFIYASDAKGGVCLPKYCQTQREGRKRDGNIARYFFLYYISYIYLGEKHKCGVYHKFNSIQRSTSFVIYICLICREIYITTADISVFLLLCVCVLWRKLLGYYFSECAGFGKIPINY